MVGKLAAEAKPRGRPRKKRKGRPARASGASAAVSSHPPPATPPPPPPASRRSVRQRRPRRVDDYADYDDDEGYYFEELLVEEEGDEDVVQEDDEEEDAEWKRREKKFKLLQKLPNHNNQRQTPSAGGDVVAGVGNGTGNRGGSAGVSSVSPSEEDDDVGAGAKILGKKKIRVHGGRSGGDGCDVGLELRSDGSGGGQPEMEDGRRHAAPVNSGPTSGSMVGDCPISTPLPDKKMLQAILDKLQKKDIYGVFAEPVDPEELPDYHEIIEHPMDFGTIKKKLSTGGYANLEEFESDVFLLCTNAMEYNAPDTIYFRQARSIQVLARKKFQSIRFESDDTLKSEQKAQSNYVNKKPVKSFLSKAAQEPAGFHISSAATVISTGDACIGLDAVQAGPSELPVVEGFVDGSLTCDSKSEKGEENSVKGSPVKLGRKSIIVEEDHRTTYNTSNELPDPLSDSVFSTFENEQKHLVAVGLDTEYSYARSLARFAGTLGPIAWRIASEKIEKALPTGVKFGPGWVGQYEPVPTPVLFFESNSQQQPDRYTHIQPKGESLRDKTKDEKKCTQPITTGTVQLCPRVPSDALTIGVMNGKTNNSKELFKCSEHLEQRPHLFGLKAGSQHIISNAMSLQHESLAVTSAKEYSNPKVVTNVSGKTIPQNSPGMMGTVVDIVAYRPEKCLEVANLGSQELISSSKNKMQPEIHKQPEMVAYCPGSASSCIDTRRMPNGKGGERLAGISRPNPSLGFITTKQMRGRTDCLNQGGQMQTIDDPAELLRLVSGRVQDKGVSSNSLLTDNQKQVMPSVVPPRSNSSSAATAAARAWMSVGRSSEHKTMDPSNHIKIQAGAAVPGNLTSEYLVSTSRILEDDKKTPMPSMSQLPNQSAVDESFLRNNGLTGFPQLIMTQLSRFHDQTPWRGLVPHVQQKQKDMQPPDLNIGFHSPGSPIRQSSVLVDSQQPDLALQL